jgi:uncharacterized protein with LGFP repeats
LNFITLNTANAACITQAQAVSAIKAKFNSNTWLGNPIGTLQGSIEAGGWFQQYSVQNGSIWISACANTGAHIVQGLIHSDYISIGAQNTIGFPTSDELRDSNNNPVSWFQFGSIWYQWGNTKAFEVQGYIQNKWSVLGWFSGALGYPTSNELPFKNNFMEGRYNSFQNGFIVYKKRGNWQSGTFPILNKSYSSSNLIPFTNSTDQLGGVVTVYGYNFKPNSKLSLLLNNWGGSFLVENQVSDANGNVKFGPHYYDNNEAGTCTASNCVLTLEVNDGVNQFAVVGANY